MTSTAFDHRAAWKLLVKTDTLKRFSSSFMPHIFAEQYRALLSFFLLAPVNAVIDNVLLLGVRFLSGYRYISFLNVNGIVTCLSFLH